MSGPATLSTLVAWSRAGLVATAVGLALGVLAHLAVLVTRWSPART